MWEIARGREEGGREEEIEKKWGRKRGREGGGREGGWVGVREGER